MREILLEGLKRLEYRGYDSAGLAFISPTPNALARQINTIKTVGKVNKLVSAVSKSKAKASGRIGIAHTRWATHGKPSVANAHPHLSGADIALVHNGIIENYESLRAELRKAGYTFDTDTDTETIAHLIHANRAGGKVSLLSAVKKTVKRLEGAYGLCVIDNTEPDKLVVARSGSPLVIGVGIGENFVASDPLALGQVTDRFIYLEEGDIAQVERESITIWHKGKKVNRPTTTVAHQTADSDKGRYEHFMLKEIYEQPRVIQDTLDGRVSKSSVLEQAFGINAPALFDKIKTVQIVACGTSSHAGLVAKYWFESIAKLPCQVDIASDYRYRDIIAQPDTLFVTISQSGETADTLAALRYAKKLDYVATLAICNVATSSLVRESDISMLTMAGQEIGVASTKAFTTQLTILLVLAIVLARRTGLTTAQEAKLVKELHKLPGIVEKTLGLRKQIKTIAKQFSDK
ncbi:glutamine--fructose-6-phosphate transaminase (isomerizing), partial [Gammaproteobacteria bacterium]|nr:glutamine--fructose-6-phosphate transaminase (isomerizing) [Gammaproteobacteria bacterium]